jgi:two-component sensor histidine kinase
MEIEGGIYEAAGVFERRLIADQDAPRIARAMAREVAVGLDDHDAANLYLAVSELVTNAVVHGHGRGLTVRLARTRWSLRVEVRDEGTGGFIWPDAELAGRRPHGLDLVQHFTDRCGVDSVPETVAWCEFDMAA